MYFETLRDYLHTSAATTVRSFAIDRTGSSAYRGRPPERHI